MIFAALMLSFRPFESGLANYDDCYYAQKAKEILQTGSWWTMHFAGRESFDNPPLFMWLLAVSYKIFGVGEYAARFPSFLFGMGAVFLTYHLAKQAYGPWVGFCAGFILTTTTIFEKYAHHAMIDVTLTFFVLLAVMGFRAALKGNPWGYFVLGMASAVSILLKSVLGLFPLCIAAFYLFLARRYRSLFWGKFPLACLLACGLGGVWFIRETLQFGKPFLQVHFGWLILERGFQEGPQPWWNHLCYLQDMAIYYWPWIPFCVWGGWILTRRRSVDPEALLFIVWPLVYLGVMSVMKSRVIWYVMPAFPAFAIWSSVALEKAIAPQNRTRVLRWISALAVATFLVLEVFPIRTGLERSKDVRQIAPYVKALTTNGKTRVTAYHQVFNGLNNSLLFYSDRCAEPIYGQSEELARSFSQPGLEICLVERSDAEQLMRTIVGVYPVKLTDHLSLIANRVVDTSFILP
jgi:4-amino-4-deoxy-L-arabinose transferase-like glycosyltransferase